jgi:hypothetical protein
MTLIERIYADLKIFFIVWFIRVNPLKSLVTVAAHFAAYRHLVVSSDLIRVPLP